MFLFGKWHDHVIFTERNTRFTRLCETKAHDAIGENHRRFLAAVTIDQVNQTTHFFLGHQFIDRREFNVFVAWQMLGKQHASWSGLHQFHDLFAFIINRFEAAFDFRMQGYCFVIECLLNFSNIDKRHAFARLAFEFLRNIIKS